MEDKQQEIKEFFSENLKALEYMHDTELFWKDVPELFRFMIMFIHNAFQSGKLHGSKLLEIGSGVTVHSVASASQYFKNIVMSDYVEDNLNELKKWLKGDSSIRQFLDVQSGLEGYGYDLETGKRIIESRIRRSVKRVTRCDLIIDGILLEEESNPETSAPFDVVISCLCLEVAPVDVKEYANILKRINHLIRPGGGLLLAGFLGGGLWKSGNNKFPQIKLKEEDLLKALSGAGFGKIELQTMGKKGLKDTEFEYDRLYCLVAEKM